VPIDVDDHLLLRNAEPLDSVLDDADVRLMRHVQVDVVHSQSELVEKLLGRRYEYPRGELEYLASIHVDEMTVSGDGLLRGRLSRTAGRQKELHAARA